MAFDGDALVFLSPMPAEVVGRAGQVVEFLDHIQTAAETWRPASPFSYISAEFPL
jgi:hypothetical protein